MKMRSRFEEKTKQNNKTFSVQIFEHKTEVKSGLKGDET